MQTENVISITFICVFVNACKFVLCIAFWKLEHLNAQLREVFIFMLSMAFTGEINFQGSHYEQDLPNIYNYIKTFKLFWLFCMRVLVVSV